MSIVYNKDHIATGKRKRATARVSLKKIAIDKPFININKMPAQDYFQYNLESIEIIRSPLKLLGLEQTYGIFATVKGGGLTGQAEAIRLGVTRLLCSLNAKHRPKLKTAGLLTRDARIKERKKYGLRKARKAPQYSKR